MKALFLIGAALLGGQAAAPAIAAGDHGALRMVFVDVEGGAATLIVTPQGHSLLIDTGWPAALGDYVPPAGNTRQSPKKTSAQRIVAAAKELGLTRIDYLLLTHYHTDHVGGAVELIGAFPIGTFVDHGANREPAVADAPGNRRVYQAAELYAAYLAAIRGRPHRTMTPGQSLVLDDLVVTAVVSDGAIIDHPLPGAGAPGVGCRPMASNVDLGTDENPRSLGTVLRWGKARILALGDTTRAVEDRLACPNDLVGPVDLMIADNHGTDNAGSAMLLDTLKPSIYVFNNGATKGADPASLQFIGAAPYVRGKWQVHYARRSPDDNAPLDQIANLDGADDRAHALHVAIAKNGTISITNPRTGVIKTYPKVSRP